MQQHLTRLLVLLLIPTIPNWVVSGYTCKLPSLKLANDKAQFSAFLSMVNLAQETLILEDKTYNELCQNIDLKDLPLLWLWNSEVHCLLHHTEETFLKTPENL